MPPLARDNPTTADRLLVAVVCVIALPFLVVGLVVGLLIGLPAVTIPVAILVGLGAGSALVLPARRHAEERALRLLTVRPAERIAHARLYNLVEALCAGAGVVRPQLFVLDRAAPNAITFGRDARHGCLVVTEGLLADLTLIELEGVVAHEIAHLRAGDTIRPTLALALCGSLADGVLAGVATSLVERSAPPRREATADLTGVTLTRYPPGLLAALQRIRDEGATLVDVPAATGPLWLVPMSSPTAIPVLDERIEALQEL
jgi:heat shock protein HtpX